MARKLLKDQQKRLILKTLATSDNVSEACQSAKCTRTNYNEMVSSGYITESELFDAFLDYGDMVLAKMNEVGLHGVKKQVIRYNKPVVDANGEPIYEYQVDVSTLGKIGERLEDKQKRLLAQRDAPIDTIPSQFRLVIDARDLEKSEFKAIMKIAQAIEDRSNTVNADMPVTSHEKPARLSTLRKGMKSMGTGKRSSTHAMTND